MDYKIKHYGGFSYSYPLFALMKQSELKALNKQLHQEVDIKLQQLSHELEEKFRIQLEDKLVKIKKELHEQISAEISKDSPIPEGWEKLCEK